MSPGSVHCHCICIAFFICTFSCSFCPCGCWYFLQFISLFYSIFSCSTKPCEYRFSLGWQSFLLYFQLFYLALWMLVCSLSCAHQGVDEMVSIKIKRCYVLKENIHNSLDEPTQTISRIQNICFTLDFDIQSRTRSDDFLKV